MLPRVNIFEEVGCAEHGTDAPRPATITGKFQKEIAYGTWI